MAQGIALARYSLNQLLAVTDKAMVTASPEVEKAKALLVWIDVEKVTHIYSSYKQKTRPRKFRRLEDFNQAVTVLVNRGYLYPKDEMLIDGKKRKKAWEVLHSKEPENN